MSSPYEPGTKGGTEETIQAISKTIEWASRIDTKNDTRNLDVDSFVAELSEEETRLRHEYRMKVTETEVANFVVNHEDKVGGILTGDLDVRVRELDNLETYISEAFGYLEPFSFSKEELLWLVAQGVMEQQESGFCPEVYESDDVLQLDLDEMGSRPEEWDDSKFRFG